MRDCEPSARGICRRLPKTGSSGPSLCFRKLGSFVSADGPSKLRLLIGMNRMIGTVINQPCRFIIPIIRASYGMHGDELTQGIARLCSLRPARPVPVSASTQTTSLILVSQNITKKRWSSDQSVHLHGCTRHNALGLGGSIAVGPRCPPGSAMKGRTPSMPELEPALICGQLPPA